MSLIVLLSVTWLDVIISIGIGAFASFVAWIFPAEFFTPKLNIKSYGLTRVDETSFDRDHKEITTRYVKRNIIIVNDSRLFAAYDITCYAELFDETHNSNNLVYQEFKKLPIVKANVQEENSIVLSFDRKTVEKLKEKNVTKIKLNLIFNNRYGTKKTIGPWWVKNFYIPEKSGEHVSLDVKLEGKNS